MCGIVGIWNYREGKPVDERQLVGMANTLVHRGPDAEGTYVSGSVGLGHRRLSIIDLAGGAQPMSNEDGSVWTMLNGEIYNYVELREALVRKGHTFATNSDTEVIVHQYEEDGPDCVESFRGMFALAIWDERKASLVLARDRFGKKPLFVADSGQCLAFASEIKALLRLPWVDRSWNADALSAYLMLGYAPAPLTPHMGVRKLHAGSVETWTCTATEPRPQHTVRRYWLPTKSQTDLSLSFPDAECRLLELLKESVGLRLRSDVPLGAFLSGGVDSSAVIALMRLCGAERIKTFSLGFESDEHSELPFAEHVARAMGTEHHTQVVTAADAMQIGTILEGFDEPFADDSVIPTFFVSRLAREHVTVSLSGDGGDELFAGYDHYRRLQRLSRIDMLPLGMRRVTSRAAAAVVPRHARGGRFVRDLAIPASERNLRFATSPENDLAPALSQRFREFLASGDSNDSWSAQFVDDGSVSGGQRVDQRTYLVDDILVKVDRCSMAVSLEARAPLLDHKVAEFANSLPTPFKLRRGVSKLILKDVMRPYVPGAILDRPKRGFGMPLIAWLRGPLRSFARESLLDVGRDLFDEKYVTWLLEADDSRTSDWAKRTWALLSLAAWVGRQKSRPW